MSNQSRHRDLSCEEHSQLLPELALGCLDGRERAMALGHIRNCARCRRELSDYQALAGELLDLAPAVPPPAGFEVRVLAAMKAPTRAQPRPGPARAGTARRRGRLLAAAAAMIVMIAAALFGGYQLGRPGTPGPPLQTAALITAGRQVGAAYVYTGSRPWVWVSVWAAPGLAGRTLNVTCVLRPGTGGPPVTIGTFTVVSGHGSWGSPLPQPLGTATLTLSRARQTLATATIRT
jgi:hypothetical protein